MTTPSTNEKNFDQDALLGLINAIKEDPEVGKTVWKASTQWLGGFRSQAQIRDFTIGMDEPTALGGSDTGPNMVEVVLGAYGCCLTTGYAANAALRGIDLEDIQIDLEGDLDLNAFLGLQTPQQCCPGYTNVRATVKLKAPDATPEQIAELHEAVKATSPVGAILGRPVEVMTELHN
ncbi:OsmC family protein [Microbaculum sp. FT89]|uniref:OsmC family protein n=1 Tax=Microbaculum sp. FT89 TaxID=3447298 RepID=UPI003F52F929